MATMNISLPGPMAEFVRATVERDYGNASEFFRDLFFLLYHYILPLSSFDFFRFLRRLKVVHTLGWSTICLII